VRLLSQAFWCGHAWRALPGIISNKTLPGGGTTDYAVEIYYEAIKNKAYTSYIRSDCFMDMMYMPDAIKAAIEIMEADGNKLIHRNAFNVTAMSLNPEILAESIRKFIPEFSIDFNVDPVRQAIADSWPDSLDDSAARIEWNWQPEFNLEKMTADMITTLRKKLS
jgi:nucleoside-diphosphate-sugar epimerase